MSTQVGCDQGGRTTLLNPGRGQCSSALPLPLPRQPSPLGIFPADGCVTGWELRFELRGSPVESALPKNTQIVGETAQIRQPNSCSLQFTCWAGLSFSREVLQGTHKSEWVPTPVWLNYGLMDVDCSCICSTPRILVPHRTHAYLCVTHI